MRAATFNSEFSIPHYKHHLGTRMQGAKLPENSPLELEDANLPPTESLDDEFLELFPLEYAMT